MGHGIFSLQGKQQWVGWMQQITGVNAATAAQLMFFVGLLDVTVALLVLVKPMRPVLAWAVFWGFWTALLRPLVGQPIWDFVERSANWAAPLALFLLISKKK